MRHSSSTTTKQMVMIFLGFGTVISKSLQSKRRHSICRRYSQNDLQLRLRYAGIEAKTINSVDEMVDEALSMPAEWKMYAIANYTSLPAVRDSLMARADKEQVAKVAEGTNEPTRKTHAYVHQEGVEQFTERPLRIVHLFPDLLNLYGDGGNVRVWLSVADGAKFLLRSRRFISAKRLILIRRILSC